MKKWILIGLFVLLVVIMAGGLWFWNAMQQPLYTPGMVRAGQNLSAPLAPPPQSEETDYWTVENGIRLYHFAVGSGENVLVMHGGPGYPFSAPLAGLDPLTSRYRFHYYDQRGSGKSTRPIERFESSNYYKDMETLDRTLGLGAQIADIERIRQLLGQDKLILIGHSFGAFLASLYASEFPEHVKALILVAPAETLVMPPERGGLFEQLKPLLPPEMKYGYDAYLARYLDYGNLFSRNEFELAALNAEFARYYTVAAEKKGFKIPVESQPVAPGGWMVQAMYLSMGLRHDYRGALKALNAPVLVLHGERDLQPEKASRLYAETFPNAEFYVIKDAGHFSFADQPAEFARVVGAFLDLLE